FNVGASQDAEENRESKKRDLQTERERLPYRYGDDIIFIWGRSVWTGFVLTTTTDEHTSSADLVPEALKLPGLLHQVGREYHRPTFQLMLVPRRPDLTGWADDLLEQVWNPTTNYRTLTRREAHRAMGQERLGAQYDVVFLIRLGALTESRRGGAVVASVADQATGVHDEYLDPRVVA